MQNPKPSSKMFLDIVGELKSIITEEGIETGGKLPSERELAERLQAGDPRFVKRYEVWNCSDLSKPRRGEGTFLVDFRKHQLVEVLAAFIMQQPDSVTDVQETRRIHETAAILTICKDSSITGVTSMGVACLKKIDQDGEILREDLVREMIVAAGNRLSLKIWFLLKQYSKVPFGEMTKIDENESVKMLLLNLCDGNVIATLEAYSEWIKLVESERGDNKK